MNEFDTKAEGWDMNPMHFERSEAIAKQISPEEIKKFDLFLLTANKI